MKNNLEIIKQFILRSDENIDTSDVWPAYLRIMEYLTKDDSHYLMPKDVCCYSCGEEIKLDGKGILECYCNDCERMDNPNILTGDELKRTEEARKRGE